MQFTIRKLGLATAVGALMVFAAPAWADDNEATIDQAFAGSGNDAEQTQNGISDIATITQGTFADPGAANNKAKQTQTGTGAGGTASIEQTGDWNEATQTQAGEGNIAEINQSGSWVVAPAQKATQTQTGDNNEAYITQTGDDSQATQSQTGNSHWAKIQQGSNDFNIATQTQTSDNNSAYINQTGSSNQATQTQSGTGAGNNAGNSAKGGETVGTYTVVANAIAGAEIEQGGVNNTALQTQTGNLNEARIVQNGDNSVSGSADFGGSVSTLNFGYGAEQSQSGASNYALINQSTGVTTGNRAYQLQESSNNIAVALQDGNNGAVWQDQSGSGNHKALVSQLSGSSGNTAYQEQSGSTNTAIATQGGSSNKARQIQH